VHIDTSCGEIADAFLFANLGVVSNIYWEVVRDSFGKRNYRCYVFFYHWYENAKSRDVQARIAADDRDVKLEHGAETFWLLQRNTRSAYLSVTLEHYDIDMCVPAQFSLQTVDGVLEAMDIVDVHSVILGDSPTRDPDAHTATLRPECAAQIMHLGADAESIMGDTVVRVSVDFWRQTQTAVLFQSKLLREGVVLIPLGACTILRVTRATPPPAREGTNPFMWINPNAWARTSPPLWSAKDFVGFGESEDADSMPDLEWGSADIGESNTDPDLVLRASVSNASASGDDDDSIPSLIDA
jgi:hypothetical protein